jgi:phosphoserine phosphatase
MDGTLTRDPSSWVRLHRHFGTLDVGDRNLALYAARRIGYREFVRRDVRAWMEARGEVHVSEVERVLGSGRLAPGAARTLGKLRDRGVETAIVSSGVDLMARKVAERLGIGHVRANGLETDPEGYLTGEPDGGGVDPRGKDRVLRALCRKLSLEPVNAVAVGDSRYDARFLKAAGLGVAVAGDEELERVADARISRLEELLRWF